MRFFFPAWLLALALSGAGSAVCAQPVPPTPVVRAFPLTAVRLLAGSPFHVAKETDRAYLLSLEPDRFLHFTRKAAGLEPKAPPYGGWDASLSHILGHYLTACALMHASTGDARLLDRVTYLVSELALCQQQRPDGGIFVNAEQAENYGLMRRGVFRYASAGPEFPFVNGGNPWYTTHKLMAGLRDAYQQTGNAQAKTVLLRFADWAYDLVMPIPDSTFQKSLDVEHGGMTELFADVYALTGQPKYLDLARKFVHWRVVRPLLEGRDALFPHHANAQIPKFIGYQRLYEVAGDSALGRAARTFFGFVLQHHTLVIGGNSEYERFGPAGQTSRRIGLSSAETCNTYNMLKLAGHLYRQTAGAGYAEYYERALYNHILAAIDPRTGMFCYYLSTKPGFFKTFSTPHNSNWCCVGTGMENPGQYETAIYAHDANSLLVNLFIPSRLTWAEKAFGLRQEGRFPETDTVRFTVESPGKQPLTLRLRNPAWAGGNAQLWVNNQAVATTADAPYLAVTRRWRKGDRLTLVLPQSLRVETTPDNPHVGAILHGPLVLAGVQGNLAEEGIRPYAEDHWASERQPAGPLAPVLVGSLTDLSAWIRPLPGQGLRFEVRPQGAEPLTLVPFYQITQQRYSVYWDLFSPEAWQTYRQTREETQRDAVLPGDSLSETAHGLRGVDTRAGRTNFRSFRTAGREGWFSYELKGETARRGAARRGAAQPLFLVCQFWGGTWEGAWGPQPSGLLDVFVNDVYLTTKNLGDRLHETLFYDEIYPLPAHVRDAEGPLTVRFQPRNGPVASGVFGCRLVTAEGLALLPLLRDP